MKRLMYALVLLGLVLPLGAGAETVNITIPDLIADATFTPGQASGVGGEDQEVEAGCIAAQRWDLEGFFVDRSTDTLSMVGGFDFINGRDGYKSGDIFLDIDGKLSYGTDITPVPTVQHPNPQTYDPNGYSSVNNIFGYEYVVDIDWENYNWETKTGTYNIVDIDLNNDGLAGGETLVEVYYGQNEESNPYRYLSGGKVTGSGTFTYQTNVTGTGFLGNGTQPVSADNTHNKVVFDSFFDVWFDAGLPVSTATLHFTEGCGNDTLMGKTAVVPVPAAAGMGLLGSILLGIVRRRKSQK